jgi:hypothetical protein
VRLIDSVAKQPTPSHAVPFAPANPAAALRWLLIVVVACLSSSASGNPLARSSDGRLLRPLVVVDEGMGDMPAYRLLVPTHFKTQLGVKWDPTSRYSYANFVGRVVDPRTGGELHFHPSLFFEFLQMPGAPEQRHGSRVASNGNTWMPQPDSAKQLTIDVLIPALRPDATDVEFVTAEDFPDVNEILQQRLKPYIEQREKDDEQSRQAGIDPGRTSMRLLFQRVRVTYTENDQAYEEDFFFTIGFLTMSHKQEGGLPARTVFNWNVSDIKSIRAAEGELDSARPSLVSVAVSVRRLPEYDAVLWKLAAELSRIELRAAIKQAEAYRRNAAELSRIREDTYKSEMESSDRQHGQFIDSIQGVDRWRDSGGSSYAIPQEHGIVWKNNQGDIYVTNDELINPGVTVDPALTWERLERQE